MTDARVRLKQDVRTEVPRRFSRFEAAMATLVGATCTFAAAPAHADDAAGGIKVSLDGSSDASASPTADQGSSDSGYSESRSTHPANYEFAFVSVGAYQTWAIAGHVLYFGAGGGVGPPLYRFSMLGGLGATPTPGPNGTTEPKGKATWDPSLDIVYGNIFLRFSPVDYVDLDVGPKIAITSALFDAPDAPEAGFSYGGYVDLRVGSKNIKLGPRFEYDRIAYANYYDKGWRLTPLMLRVVH